VSGGRRVRVEEGGCFLLSIFFFFVCFVLFAFPFFFFFYVGSFTVCGFLFVFYLSFIFSFLGFCPFVCCRRLVLVWRVFLFLVFV